MSTGDKVIEAIIRGGLCHAECAENKAHPCIVVWSSGAAEQIEAVATKAIERVEQADRSGCAIACAAMVTGKTYAEVKDFWVREMGGDPWLLEAVGNGAGLSSAVLAHLIARLLPPGAPKPDVFIGSQPIIRTVRSPMGWHYIVIDGDGNVFNPA